MRLVPPLTRRTALLSPGVLIATLVMLAGFMAATPAQAGEGLYITLRNELPGVPSAPGYPRLALRGGANLCWDPGDLKGVGTVAPAGGGSATAYSEADDSFFSVCNPWWVPVPAPNIPRWQQFELVSQARPGEPWETVTWGSDYQNPLHTFSALHWKVTGDPRGYHFDIDGPSPTDVLVTPTGPACLLNRPLPLTNYDGRATLTVSKAKNRKCSLAPTTTAKPAAQPRQITLAAGRERPVVIGKTPDRRGPGALRWQVRPNACTSDHFDATGTKVERGPGKSRWQVVWLAGTNPGTGTCTVDLVGPAAKPLLSQRIIVKVK